MRLDEWQKYIDSQFLEDAPEPVAAPAPAAEAAPAQPVKTQAVQTEQDFVPEPAKQDNQDMVRFTANLAPETAPNAIQNVVTLVVAAQPVPVLPANPQPPRIELLTPMPAPPAECTPPPEVTNRTRRRSQTASASPYPPETPNAAAVSPALLLQPTSRPDARQTGEELFAPLTGMDADIPEFHRYLPSSHAAAQSAQNQQGNDPRHAATPLSTSAPTLPASASENTTGAIHSIQTDAAPAPAFPTSGPASDTSPSPALFRTVEITAPEMDALTADYEPAAAPAHAAHDSLPRPSKSRARHARNVRPDNVPSGLSASELWATVPRHVQTLLSLERLEESEVAQSSYKRPFQEKRHELIERLLDPILSLEDTARLLNVCPTTVRRYTNKGILTYYRKEPERAARTEAETGGDAEKETRQRRFRLSDILAFLETQQAAITADRRAERRQSRVETTPQPNPPQGRSSEASAAKSGENSVEIGVTFRPVKDV